MDNEMSFTIKKNHVYLVLIVLTFFIGVFFVYPALTSNNNENHENNIAGGGLLFDQAVGKQAPDFSLESIDGKTIKLSEYKGKNIILFFNEGTMCYPSCWAQIEELGNDERFNTDDVMAFSIVVDQKSEWKKIVEKTSSFSNSNAKILFDPTRAVSSAYDVLFLPSSMHKGSYPGHTYFIIDKQGVIRYVLDDPNMAIWNDELANELEKLAEV